MRKLLATILVWLLGVGPVLAVGDGERWPSAGGGGGGGFPGMTGSIGNEDTLQALYDLRDLAAYPEGGPTYYVGTAAATGD